MSFVVTLVTAPHHLFASDVEELAMRLHARVEWLAEGMAADLFCDAPPGAVELTGIDVFVQPVATRCKSALLADMESTLVQQEFLDELAERRGVADKVRELTARAMAGDIDFPAAFRERIALLRGTPMSDVQAVLDAAVPTPGAQTLVATLKAHKIPTLVVSSGLSFFTAPIAARLGCGLADCNKALVANALLTGDVEEPVRDKHTKQQTVLDTAAELGCTSADIAAVGDGANDLLMLQTAGAGYAYRAKPAVAAAAHFPIVHGDLTAILYAFGFKQAEFIA